VNERDLRTMRAYILAFMTAAVLACGATGDFNLDGGRDVVTGDAKGASSDASAEAGSFSCAPDESAGPVTCSAGQYCQISCGISAICLDSGSGDGSTCPAGTFGVCPAHDSTCPFDWVDGGSPTGGCCNPTVSGYSCVDAPPPTFDGGVLGGDCLSVGSRSFLCQCPR